MTAPTFLNPPTHYTLDEFGRMLAGLPSEGWKPKFPTLHNTGNPNLKQWLAYGSTPQERWGASLNRYYQSLGWHAGPHLVICPNYVWTLCDLMLPGVSVSCWNSETFGIEMVGDYSPGADEWTVGEGARVRANAGAVLDLLTEKFGWDDLADFEFGVRGLHFHRECVRDHHACPGILVTKADVLGMLKPANWVAPTPPRPVLPPPAPSAVLSTYGVQAALNRLGAAPPMVLDGVNGPATQAAVKTFQTGHGLDADGWVGPLTSAAIEAALAKVK